MRRRFGVGLAFGLVLALCLNSSSSPQPPPGFLGTVTLHDSQPRFGGFSAIELSSDGIQFLALSDRGAFAEGTILRNAEGLLTGAEFGPVTRLLAKADTLLAADRSDSEGLAVAEDGTAYVSFEGAARVLRYPKIDGPAENLPNHPDFARMRINTALEALAIGPDHTLYAVPEQGGNGPIPVYRFRAGAWDADPVTIRGSDGFRPVAADIGPDGRFYLLERRFHGVLGFSSRLRRFDVLPDRLAAEETLLHTPAGLHDNLEGLSIWLAKDGLRATMISDDNFFPLQVTEIVEYHLPD